MLKCLHLFLLLSCLPSLVFAQPNSSHDLAFDHLANVWDEGIPLGNGMLGALVWQRGDHLRFSLDRADLWDLRPSEALQRKEFKYAWVYNQVMKNEYRIVQDYFDAPYEAEPAPSTIPGGALEFDTRQWGLVESVRLKVQDAVCQVRWQSGITLETFVHATEPTGWFRIENLENDLRLKLVPPKYEGKVDAAAGGSVAGDDLTRLGYKQGVVRQSKSSITYTQPGWGGFSYSIRVSWKKTEPHTIEGVWSISSHFANKKESAKASGVVAKAIQHHYQQSFASHLQWWQTFWRKSSLRIPDAQLEKQWYLEQYKFGSASRRGAPPISLQAVWTADNGRLPPWKGDYHHDLNTQLSYWPSYSANHLQEGLAYYDHLDENKAAYRRYTKTFFEKGGLAVPGVTTLKGIEMGGWIQYSCSPTIAAWLAHHYYLQWRYSMDKEFLRKRAYPWIKEVAQFLTAITKKDQRGFRQLPLSSSPEINNNRINAWFLQNTNYDLALMKFTLSAAAELATELGFASEAAQWKKTLKEFGDFALSENHELMFSPTLPYNESHRHFSHTMAIHPLGLIKWEDGNKAKKIIQNSVRLLDSIGPKEWCGYSYAWLASLKARAKDGDGAAMALSIFAKAFCSPNSFHLNGDQTKSGYSSFTYRPFTLEGNFAFAAGLQEMLLQSYAGFIEVMPAVPAAWSDVTFTDLRAEGAFLVSAKKAAGKMAEIKIQAEKGGRTKLKLPFESWNEKIKGKATVKKAADGFIELRFTPGSEVVLSNRK